MKDPIDIIAELEMELTDEIPELIESIIEKSIPGLCGITDNHNISEAIETLVTAIINQIG